MDRTQAERLLEDRGRRREARDFAGADALREELRSGGWEVVDRAGGSELRPLERPPPARQATFLAILHGWRADAERWLLSLFSRQGAEVDFEALLVDNSGDPGLRGWVEGRRAERLRTLVVDPPLGFGAAVNAGLRSAAGEVVILCDPGVEMTGDVAGPLLATLRDPGVALAGGFGVRGHGDLKRFHEDPGPEVDALEGYCMAFRKEEALAVGGFDERFRFYRIADFEFSFRLRDHLDGRAVVVPGLPVRKHEHRLWESTQPDERERLSRKNFYRFLDRWRDREDMLVG